MEGNMKFKFWMFLYKINYYLLGKLIPSDNIYYFANGIKYNLTANWLIVGNDVIGYLEEK